jgi:hypothetical protein
VIGPEVPRIPVAAVLAEIPLVVTNILAIVSAIGAVVVQVPAIAADVPTVVMDILTVVTDVSALVGHLTRGHRGGRRNLSGQSRRRHGNYCQSQQNSTHKNLGSGYA